jgi:Na+/H+ antiporter NhaA
VVANSAWADAYHRLLSVMIAIGAGGHALTLTLHQWINDALMAVFFLLVGLEIKRGAISTPISLSWLGRRRRVSVPAAVSLERLTHARERIRRPFVAAGR